VINDNGTLWKILEVVNQLNYQFR